MRARSCTRAFHTGWSTRTNWRGSWRRCSTTLSAKKGLITDLDDTCWKGILGDDGPCAVRWDLAGRAQAHGLYQQFLQALADRGVLIAVASKNDFTLVQEVFSRPDIRLRPRSVFPIEACWSPKSQSVARILKTWNIGADAVVFVDDSLLELAEVQAAHAGIECLPFPKDDPAAVLHLLARLRELFGKDSLSPEDRLRSESLRSAAVLGDAARGGSTLEKLLQTACAKLRFRLGTGPGTARAFELVNKTNQFNLNGRRFREAEWQAYFRQPGAFLVTVSYEDKFGPLGEIAVVLGRVSNARSLQVDTWVMSCRAFSRRIEYRSLQYLFDKCQAAEAVLDFHETPRNGPVKDFLREFGTPVESFGISRECFEARCPPLFHEVEDL